MKLLKPNELAYWNEYLRTLADPQSVEGFPVEALVAGNAEVSDSLIELYLSGRKYAGSSLLEDYLTVGDPLPVAGRHWIVLRANGDPACILRTSKVNQCKFKDATEEIAIAEGEGDLSLCAWRETHIRFFTPFLERWGVSELEEATLITEYFELVHK